MKLTERELAALRIPLTPRQVQAHDQRRIQGGWFRVADAAKLNEWCQRAGAARGPGMAADSSVSLPMQTRNAAITPATLNRQARTVDVVWSTGAAVRVEDDRGQVVMQSLSMLPGAVRMERLNNGASVLNTHQAYDLSNVIGVVERASIRNGEGVATIRLHDDSGQSAPVVEPIWTKIVAGVIRHASVGYIVHRWQDVTPAGAAMRSLLAVDWEPCEISLVGVPADAGAGIRSAGIGGSAGSVSARSSKGISIVPADTERRLRHLQIIKSTIGVQ